MATDARHLQLVTDLDESIDKVRFPLGVHYFIYSWTRQVARQAAWEAVGYDPRDFGDHYNANPDVDGMVVGDEMRLRQIITNLAR